MTMNIVQKSIRKCLGHGRTLELATHSSSIFYGQGKQLRDKSTFSAATTQKCTLFRTQAKQDPPVSCRYFWKVFNRIVNAADEKRIEEVGKQRACAEWLVRCGAHVRWEGSEKWERDYNNLPPNIEDNFKKLKIAEVSAVDANVMFNGFVYFDGIDTLKTIRFDRCTYFGDDEMRGLGRLKDTLQNLEISNCHRVTDKGVLSLSRLNALKTLKLRNLSRVKQKQKTLEESTRGLPMCEITWNGDGAMK